MPGRILVIRGGAIGDFILTLPAIGLIRQTFPDCHLEILGYRQIAALAEKRYYADAVRSIDYAPLARFFNPCGDLDAGLTEYFASFDQVISYVYDPDALFQSSLRKAGVQNLIPVSPKILEHAHAARQLAAPLAQMALWLESPAPTLFPSPADQQKAAAILSAHPGPFVAVHPGSGSEKKNWPLDHWKALCRQIDCPLVLVGGENDTARIKELRETLPSGHLIVLENLPLPVLGAVFAKCLLYLGHDTGISHLAAAAGPRCLLLFGPTSPQVWAPANEGVQVLQAPGGDLSALDVDTVRHKLEEILTDALRNDCRH